jgi:hypothetical protein
MRDLDTNPYTPDELRVAEFFFNAGVGGGDDPIGAIIASHAALAMERNEWRQAAGVEAGLRREFLATIEKLQAGLNEEEAYLQAHFGADVGLISGDIAGSFQRIRDVFP